MCTAARPEATLEDQVALGDLTFESRYRPGPSRLTIVALPSDEVRAFVAYAQDAGVQTRRTSAPQLPELLASSSDAIVWFLNELDVSKLLPIIKALNTQRPGLALVLVAGHSDRFSVWRAFENAPLPPVVLRSSTTSAVTFDAVSLAYEACLTESADRSGGRAGAINRARVAASVRQMLSSKGSLRDQRFDRLLPSRWRTASDQFWTPLDVIKSASNWFAELGVQSIVDVGSGVGKFCVAGAMMSGNCHFTGIEQRGQLCAVARDLASLFRVEDRVTILEGRFGLTETPAADCYYFYNPFEENLFPIHEALDDDVELSADRFRQELRHFRALVTAMPIGTYVLSYNGVGGRVPDCLVEVRVDRSLPAALRLFEKVRRAKPTPWSDEPPAVAPLHPELPSHPVDWPYEE